MDITKLLIPLPVIINGANIILLNVLPFYTYVDSKKTDSIEGYKYIVVEDKTFEKLAIKIAGTAPAISQEQIQGAKDRIFVQFESALARPYRTNTGNYDLSITANGISVVKH